MPQYADIIDNRNRYLKDEINDRLSASSSVKFATGYLYLSGFYQIAESLAELEEAKILVGNNLNQKTIEELAQAIPSEEKLCKEVENRSFERPSDRKKRTQQVAKGIEANISTLPHSLEKEEKMLRLSELIYDGKIKVKVYTKHPLHAKAYIFKFKEEIAQGAGAEGIGIIGSSNLTLSGFTLNTELNTYVRNQKNYEELNDWFDFLWEEAVPFEDVLTETLSESWVLKTVNPYDIYILTLYHLVQSSMPEYTEQIWFWENESFIQRLRERFRNFQDLYSFQKVAIRQAIRYINRYNGVFISDVVGFGKTFIGAGILRQLRKRALILCPARLTEMWEEFAEKFEIDAKVCSHGMLYHGIYDDDSALRQFESRDIVLIDESHHFRNNDTKRYKELQPFLTGKKVILVTATPQNTSVWNIYNQIKLFHQTEENIFPMEESNLRNLFRKAEEGKFHLRELLKYILIRRTRNHIKKYYQGQDDFELKFPKRELETVTYDINEIYDNLYDQIVELMRELKYARYDLWRYVKQNKQEVEPYINLKKVIGTLQIFHRIRLFKRLESSIGAFRGSIDNLLEIHKRFYRIIEEHGIVPAGEEIQDRIYRYDQKKLEDYLETFGQKQPYNTDDFELDLLKSDLRDDIRVLKKILSQLKTIPEEKDPKFDVLLSKVLQIQKDKPKVLIFSEFADTVEYLHKRLSKILDNVDFATGDVKKLGAKIGAFAPKANDYKGDKKIDVMVATDILSEGHNLQDCSAVINYDLHWNPVRLIQRAGRVDRIGSEAETIQIKNFFPVDRVEKEISIKEILRRRIREIQEYIGEDERILEPDEQLNQTAMYAIYDRTDLDEVEESEELEFSFDEAESVIRQLEKQNPEYLALIKKMQLGLRSAKKNSAIKGTYAFFRKGRFSKLFIKKPDGRIIDDFSDVINEIRCEPSCPESTITQEKKAQYYDDLDELKAHFRKLLERDKSKDRIAEEVRKTKRRLQSIVRSRQNDEEFIESVAKIDAILNEFFPRQYLPELKWLNRKKTSDEDFFNQLVEMYNQHNLGESKSRGEDMLAENEPIQFVCGEIIN